MIISRFSHLKATIFIACCIFILALVARYAAYRDYTRMVYDYGHYTEGIGTGSDADYQINNAVFTIQGNRVVETFTHFDYIFLIPLITVFFRMWGYIGGLVGLMALIIILGSMVPVIWYLLLSHLNNRSLGAIFAGLALAVNPLLVGVAGGRFILDTIVYFVFSLFLASFILALETRQIRWLIAAGVLGLVESLNKPFLSINDIPFVMMFPIIFMIRSISISRASPHFKVQLYDVKNNIVKAFIPATVVISGEVLWEVFAYTHNHIYYFLGEILFVHGSDSSANFALKNTLFGAKPIGAKIMYLLSLYSRTLTELTNHTNLQIAVPLLIVLMVISLVQSRRQVMVGLSHIWYFGAVVMTITSGIAPRHYVTLVIWVIVMLSMLMDGICSKFLQRFRPRVYYVAVILLVLLFWGRLIVVYSYYSTYESLYAKEKAYYEWVDKTLPSNAIIIGGTGQDVLMMSQYTHRTVLYNAYFGGPTYIPPHAKLSGVTNFGDSRTRLMEYGAYLELHAGVGHDLYVLDDDIPGWRAVMTSGAMSQMPPGKYEIENFAQNKQLKRGIYRLILKALSDQPADTPL